MLQRMFKIIKRIFVGYGFLFALIIVGLTLGLPFILTSAMALGFMDPAMLPFSHRISQAVSLLAVVITGLVGLRWLYFPLPWLDARLQTLHARLHHPQSRLRFRFTGILIAFPLFAVILSPCALLWIGWDEVVHLTGIARGQTYRIIAFAVGFLWLLVAIGQLCPRPGPLRKLALRSRSIFIDWVLEPSNPKAASEERAKLAAKCQ